MNIKEIKELIEIINKSNLTGLEYENSGVRLVLKKEVQVVSGAPFIPIAEASKNVTAEYHHIETSSVTAVDKDVLEITSPIVGTFYYAPSPDAKPFVSVGDRVKKGQILCIIEAMKLMNEITADYDCEIEKILVNNEDVVQYGQPLFQVKSI